jgi:hypothetical protein
MIERMEREGIISGADHAGKRQIIPRDGRGGGGGGDSQEDAA